MLKKVITISSILILINMILFVPNSYAICNTIRMKKEITAVKLTLSDGQVLYNFDVKTKDSNSTMLDTSQVAQARSLDIIFLIDTKTSNLNAEKSVVQTALNSFKDYYSNNLSKLSIGIIGFNDNEMEEEKHEKAGYELKNFATDESKINEELINLQNTNRSILQAIELADANLGIYGPYTSKQQVVVIISDGISNELDKKVYEQANNRLKNIVEQKMGLVYATISNKTGLEDILSGLENFTYIYNLNKLKEQFTSGESIYNEIVYNVLDGNSNLLYVDADNVLVSDRIFLFLDAEIAHGATLEVEYLITIQAINGIENYTIQEDLGNNNLKYNENAKLMTENKTNKDVGWKIINGVPTLTGGSVGKEKTAKIILSTVISAEDFSYTYKNMATCKLTSKGLGESAATKFTRKVESPEIIIIPPFGGTEQKVGEPSKGLTVTIALMMCTITVITAIIIIIKKEK